MSDLQLEKEPVFYQHVTDETFEILIKKAVVPVAAPITNSPVSLTYEEENAVRYVGGYVVRVLRQQKENSNTTHIIEAAMQKGQHRIG